MQPAPKKEKRPTDREREYRVPHRETVPDTERDLVTDGRSHPLRTEEQMNRTGPAEIQNWRNWSFANNQELEIKHQQNSLMQPKTKFHADFAADGGEKRTAAEEKRFNNSSPNAMELQKPMQSNGPFTFMEDRIKNINEKTEGTAQVYDEKFDRIGRRLAVAD